MTAGIITRDDVSLGASEHNQIPVPPWFRVFAPDGTALDCEWITVDGLIGLRSSQRHDFVRIAICINEGKDGVWTPEFAGLLDRADESGKLYQSQDPRLSNLIFKAVQEKWLQLPSLPPRLLIGDSWGFATSKPQKVVKKTRAQGAPRRMVVAGLFTSVVGVVIWVGSFSHEEAAIAARLLPVLVPTKDRVTAEVLVKVGDPVKTGQILARRTDTDLLVSFQTFEREFAQAKIDKQQAVADLSSIADQVKEQRDLVRTNQESVNSIDVLVAEGYYSKALAIPQKNVLLRGKISLSELQQKERTAKILIEGINQKYGTEFKKGQRLREDFLKRTGGLDILSPCDCVVRSSEPTFEGVVLSLVESAPELYVESVVPRDKLSSLRLGQPISYKFSEDGNRPGTYLGVQEKSIGRLGVDNNWFLRSDKAIIIIKPDTPIKGGTGSIGTPASVLFASNRLSRWRFRVMGTF